MVKLGWSQRDSDTGLERANSYAEHTSPCLLSWSQTIWSISLLKSALVWLPSPSTSGVLMSSSTFIKRGSNRQGQSQQPHYSQCEWVKDEQPHGCNPTFLPFALIVTNLKIFLSVGSSQLILSFSVMLQFHKLLKKKKKERKTIWKVL